MKFLFDLFPVLLFFIVFKFAGANPEQAQAFGNLYLSHFVSGGQVNFAQAPILLATAVAILASLCQIAWLLFKKKTIDKMLWVSLVIVLVFGGATIYFQNSLFMLIKPTILYWIFSAFLFFSAQFFKKNWIESLMTKQVSLKPTSPASIWLKLNHAWAGFFFLMGALNIYIAFNFSEDTWVNFKLFGGMGLLLAFIILQGLWLGRHIDAKES
jgi:intracellular septation protein